MHKIIRIGFFLLLPSVAVFAKELHVGFGQFKTPYVFEKDKKGLEIDLFREALAYKGHTLKVYHFSKKRLQKVLATMPKIDAVATVQKKEGDGFYYIPEFSFFENYVISRKADGLKIRRIEDLKDLRVVAWQNAHVDLGLKFNSFYKSHFEGKEKYKEMTSQRSQNVAFWRKTTDVVIADKTIFLWYKSQVSEVIDTSEEVLYHPIFSGKTQFYAGFRDEALAKDFEKGLKHLKKTGRYDAIYKKYRNFRKVK